MSSGITNPLSLPYRRNGLPARYIPDFIVVADILHGIANVLAIEATSGKSS